MIISYDIAIGLRSNGQEKCDRYYLDTIVISSTFLSRRSVLLLFNSLCVLVCRQLLMVERIMEEKLCKKEKFQWVRVEFEDINTQL